MATTADPARPSFGEWLAGKAAEPIETTVKRYRCPHCRYSRSSRKPVVEHIARCWHNPANRACKTCSNFQPATSWEEESCEAGVTLPTTLTTDDEDMRAPLESNCPLWKGPVE